MLSTSNCFFALSLALSLSAAACTAATADDTGSSEAAATTASSVHGHAVRKLGVIFGRPIQGVETEAQAHALEAKVKDDARENAFEQCAATLGLPLDAVSTKLVGLSSDVIKTDDGRFGVTASTLQTYCSSALLDNAVLVTFDAGLKSSGTIRAGGMILLDAGLQRVAEDAGVQNKIIATVPHLMARFDGGAFHEVTGLPSVNAKKGGTIDVELPIEDDAVLFDVPSAGERFEMFYRVERWNINPSFFEDGNFTGTLASPASDAFVSNFGANYRLPVVK